MLHVTAEQYRLSVDADDALTDIMGDYDTEKGEVFQELWYAMDDHRTALFVVPLDHDEETKLEWFTPNRDAPEFVAEVGRHYRHETVKELHAAGYLDRPEADTLVYERSEGSYFYDDFCLELYTVTRGFRGIVVHYIYPNLGLGGPSRWEVTDEFEIPAGHYVVAQTGQMSFYLHSVGYADPEDFDREGAAYAAYDGEDRSASRMDAGCSESDAHLWEAESGSWRFEPSNDYGDESECSAFDYDDAEGFDSDDRIACPEPGCSGRVGFQAY